MLPWSNKGGGIRLLLFVQLLLQAYARHIGIINTIFGMKYFDMHIDLKIQCQKAYFNKLNSKQMVNY